MLLVLRRPSSAGARHRQGRTSPAAPDGACLRGLHLDHACAPAFDGSYGEPGTTKISLTQVSTVTGESRINDTRDFGIGKRLTNLPALRATGFTANRRLLDVLRLSHDPADGQAALAAISQPLTTSTGTRVPGLRLGDPRAHALLSALCIFRLLPRGFANSDLRPLLAQLLGVPAESITPGKMTYDLRRLRMHGLIERVPGTFRYQVTDTGLAHALFLTRLHDKFLRTGLAELAHPGPGRRSLATASRAYTAAIDDLARQAGIAA